MQNWISRRSFLTGAATAAGSFSCGPRSTESSSLPNIVLLMGDDHGWHETGYNGHPYVATPVLDEMAASGLQLDRFYSAAPVCSPTRGSVMTGRHPNRYGTFRANWSIRPEEIGIAQILKQADMHAVTSESGTWACEGGFTNESGSIGVRRMALP